MYNQPTDSKALPQFPQPHPQGSDITGPPMYDYQTNLPPNPAFIQRTSSYGQASSIGPWDSASNVGGNASDDHLPSGLYQPGLAHIPERRDDREFMYDGSQRLEGASTSQYDPWGERRIDEDGHSRLDHLEGGDKQGLIGSAAGFAGRDEEASVGLEESQKNGATSYPPASTDLFPEHPKGPLGLASRLMGSQGKSPIEQRIENKKRGIDKQKYPFACWVLTGVMCAVMIWELVSNYKAQGTVISLKPTINFMLGPSAEVLINDGARFVPCMKEVTDLPPSFPLACLNDTSNPATTACTLGSICGFGEIANDQTPNQGFRFILPIFLHVGIIHLALNMAAQLTVAAQIEREVGSLAFLIIYFAGGIFGFILGGNFGRTGIPSAGASGSLFAVNACFVVDLCLHWKYTDRPKIKALYLGIEFILGIAIGYIPFAVDGMAHLGGYAMGLLLGIVFYPAINETKRRTTIVWGLRAVALPIVIVAFVLSVKNFYTEDPNAACTWCRYLSCIPTTANNRCTGTGLNTIASTSRRSWEL